MILIRKFMGQEIKKLSRKGSNGCGIFKTGAYTTCVYAFVPHVVILSGQPC